MRIFRNIAIFQLILELILLGALIVLIVATLLFWNKSGGIKTLGVLALAITFLLIRLYFTLNILKSEESLYRKNMLNRLLFQRRALEEQERIKELREGLPSPIHAKLNRVLTSNLIWMRMLHYKLFIRLLFFNVSIIVLWLIFNFRFHLSIALGLIIGFILGHIWHTTINRRIVIIFEKEFPNGSSERAIAIDYLSKNKYTYWFALELLKIVGLYSDQQVN